MKALTIWQPWASLIVAGAKPYEFRGWRFPSSMIGQRVGIHAAARPMKPGEIGAIVADLQSGGLHAACTCLHAEIALPILRDAVRNGLPISAMLGSAVLGEPRNGIRIAEEFGVPRANDSDRDDHANWGWPMLDIERFAEPIPARGAQGFWNWTTAESAAEMFA